MHLGLNGLFGSDDLIDLADFLFTSEGPFIFDIKLGHGSIGQKINVRQISHELLLMLDIERETGVKLDNVIGSDILFFDFLDKGLNWFIGLKSNCDISGD